jgi:rare lipoprotein A (peptidoglycan hydrolase)
MTWKRRLKIVVLAAVALAVWPRGLGAIVLLRVSNGRQAIIAQTVQSRTVQFGVASYYGSWHRGHITASGMPFDDRKLTAAHRTLPLGTHVQVTNLKNGRSVIVKINDRGPYVGHRLIDVSAAAARVLGFTHRGVTPVKVRVVDARKGREGSAPIHGGEVSLNAGGGS